MDTDGPPGTPKSGLWCVSMASVRPHGDGWQVRYRHTPGGRQSGRTFTTERAAVRWAKLVDAVGAAAAERALVDADPDATPTLAEFADAYVTSLTGIKDGTRAKYRQIIATFAELLQLPVTVVTRDAVAAWVNAQAAHDAGVSGKTIKNRHALLSQVLGAAVEAGHLPANPARGLRLPRTDPSPTTYMSHEDLRAILARLDPWWHPLVLTLAGTGLRFGEATALRWCDLDLEGTDPSLRVVHTWEKAPGGMRMGVPKTPKSRRTIGIGDRLVEVLTERRQLVTPAPTDLVFTGPASGRWPDGGRVGEYWRSTIWARAVEAACPYLHPRPTPHDLRHAHVRDLVRAGVPLPDIQARLGHESISTTIDVYGDLIHDTTRAAALAADLALDGILATDRPPGRRKLRAV